MLTMLMTLAVLVPGLELWEQPHLSDRSKSRAFVIAQLQQAIEESASATSICISEGRCSKGLSSYLSPSVDEPWATLADCESGDWENGGKSFVPGSARWDWGAPGAQLPPWGTTIHHGGLQFHPDTWRWVAPMVGLGHIDRAYQATPSEQIRVAERTQELQGWGAWPVCSQKVGLR